ncbi:hypothetical protein ACFLWR_05780 [Chloroflexota bacterium]
MRRKIVMLFVAVCLLSVGLLGGSILTKSTLANPGDSVSIPQTINYQGLLTDKETGEALEGTVDIVFSLYDLPTGGTLEWQETHSANVSNGLFNVILGSINPLSADNFTGERYLGIKVGTDEEMTPRQALTSVPYAFQAENTNTLEGYSVSTLPVDWTNLENVPSDFADGADNDTTYSAGTGLVLTGTEFNLSGSIDADTLDSMDSTDFVSADGDNMTGSLSVNGTVESTSGGFKFPDGSVQTSGNVKQLIHDFVVASGENVTAGDVVTFFNGYVQKGSVLGDSIIYDSEYKFDSTTTSHLSATALSSTKFVVAYQDPNNSYYGIAIIGDVFGNSITYGSEYVFNSDITQYISVAALSSTKFVVAYRDDGNSNYGTAIIGDVWGSTITYGSEYVFNSDDTADPSVDSLSSTQFVVAFRASGGKAIIGNVSGNTIAFGSLYVFEATGKYYISVASLSSTKFAVAYQDTNVDDYGTAIIGDVSGDNITFGLDSKFNSAITAHITVAALSSNQFVVAYRDDGNSYYGTAVICDVSGNSITYGSEYVFNSGFTTYPSAESLSSTQFVVTYRDDGNSNRGTSIVGDVSGNSITYGSEYLFHSAPTYRTSAVALSSTKFVVAFSGADSEAVIGEFLADIVIGIARETKLAGQTVSIIISGISDLHSGLIPGRVYYIDTSGELTTSTTDSKIGLAVSETEILLSTE